MPTDLATTYTAIPADQLFHADRVACLDGQPIRTRLALNEALAHDQVEWKTVEDHFGPQPGGQPFCPTVADGTALVVWDDDADLTLPADAVLYVHQS